MTFAPFGALSSACAAVVSATLVVFADAGVTIGLVISGANAAAALILAYATLTNGRQRRRENPRGRKEHKAMGSD